MTYRQRLRSALAFLAFTFFLIHAAHAQKNTSNYSLVIEMQGVSHSKGPYRISKVIDHRESKDTLGFARIGNLNKPVPVIAAQPIEKTFEVYINSFFNHCPECKPFTMVITKIELSELDEAASQHAVAIIEAEFYETDSTGADVLFHTTMAKSKTAHRDATAWLEEELRKAIGMVLDDLGSAVELSALPEENEFSNTGVEKQKTCTMEFQLSMNRFLLCGKPYTAAMIRDRVDYEKYPELYTELGRYKRSREIAALLCFTGGAALGASAAMFILDKEQLPGLLIGGVVSTFIGIGIILTSGTAGNESARLYNIAFGLQNIDSSNGKRAFVAGYTWQF